MSGAGTLYVWRRDAIGLQEALEGTGGRRLKGICYAPLACGFAEWIGGRFVAADRRLELEQIFEGRFFDEQGEFRWLRDPAGGGKGTAIYVADQTDGFTGLGDPEPLPVLGWCDETYLVWGQSCGPHDDQEDWSCVSSAAIGTLLLPVGDLPNGYRVALEVREYFALARGEAGEDGNVVVVEERLRGLKVRASESAVGGET